VINLTKCKKVPFIPPRKAVEFIKKLETLRIPNNNNEYVSIMKAIAKSLNILSTYKVREEGVRTLIFVYALNSENVLGDLRLIEVAIDQVESLDMCSTVALSNKLHRLAGKNFLIEDHSDSKRVYFKLSELSENVITGYLKNILF
jgi:hypothetical protein